LLFLVAVFEEVLFLINPYEPGFKSGSVFMDIDDVARQTAGQAERRLKKYSNSGWKLQGVGQSTATY
jgi:hypothetical protein